MNTRLVVQSLVVLGVTVFASSAQAQRRVAVSRRGAARMGSVHGRNAGGFFAGSAFVPFYFSDYDSEPGAIGTRPPQIVIVQPAPSAPPAPAPTVHESLVLELHGDHWIRITNDSQSRTSGQSNPPGSEVVFNPPPARPPATPRRTQVQEPPIEHPPAVLVFRDAHKEEIGKYAIIGATIYTSADYWSSGSWTRQIRVAELDVPATLKLNQERGSNFRLPSGPNEVMVHP